MKAMILAAGRGTRMRPLTDHTHKGLLTVAGVPMIEYHVKKLAAIGIKDIVINVSYLAKQIQSYLKDGDQHGVTIHYSLEEQPLEVGGGIIKALPLLGTEPFIVINCDVWTDFPLQVLPNKIKNNAAHIVLVNNPEHKQQGDFHLNKSNQVEVLDPKKSNNFTFSGIAIYQAELFSSFPKNCSHAMLPILKKAIDNNLITGELYNGIWHDIGTPERLAEVKSRHNS